MGVTCRILLTNNTNGVYRAGQSVRGSVKYVVDKPTEFTSVTLSLRGKGLCWWVPLIAYIGTIYTGSEDYVDQRMDLLQVEENGTAIIPAGTYEKHFCFVLPEVIPSTYKDFRCFIAYFVELKFVKPNFMTFSKRFDIDIKVQGGIKPYLVQPMVYETKKVFLPSKKTVTLRVELENMFLYSGDTIKVKDNIDNQSDVNITGTKVELIEYITYKSNCKHEKQKLKTISGIDFKGIGMANLSHDCGTIQNLSPLYTTSEIFSIYSNVFIREYRVRVALKFDFPYKDLCMEIPVVIAEKIDESAEVQLDDQPPSYWQVMNEKKE